MWQKCLGPYHISWCMKMVVQKYFILECPTILQNGSAFQTRTLIKIYDFILECPTILQNGSAFQTMTLIKVWTFFLTYSTSLIIQILELFTCSNRPFSEIVITYVHSYYIVTGEMHYHNIYFVFSYLDIKAFQMSKSFQCFPIITLLGKAQC